MEDDLRVVSIALENVMALPVIGGRCYAELHFAKPEPGKGQLITLTGDNEVGKSSFLAGVVAIFEGGHDPRLIRNGEEKATGRMLLNDGTDVTRTQTRNTYDLKIFRPGSDQPLPKAETFVKTLANGIGFDPIRFDQDKTKRIDTLCKVFDLQFTPEEIGACTGNVVNMPPEALDIRKLAKLQRDLAETRAAIGRRRDERSSTVETFRKSLLAEPGAMPDGAPTDWKAELAAVRAERNHLSVEDDAEIDLIQQQAKTEREVMDADIRLREDAARAEFQKAMDAIREDKQRRAGIITAAEMAAFNEVRARNAAAREALAAREATAEAAIAAGSRINILRTEKGKFQREVEALSGEYTAADKAVKAIDHLRKSKLENLPVKGLEVRDEEIFVSGIPWEKVNQSKRWLKSFEIGSYGAGALNLMVADEAECLGPVNWKAFEAAVIESGRTVIAARLASKEEIERHGPQLRSEPQGALSLG